LDEQTIYRTLSGTSQYYDPYNYGVDKSYGTGLDILKVGMYEQAPYYGAYHKFTNSGSSGSSRLLDYEVLIAGPLTSLGSREHRAKRFRCDEYGFPKFFDPVIAPPKKRVPKDITNLPIKEVQNKERHAHTRVSEKTENAGRLI
jgi:hypothetical protein